MALHSELWFPSVVWSGMMHSVDNVDIAQYAYRRKKEDQGVVISNYGGWQSSPVQAGENLSIDYLIREILDTEIDNCRRQVGLPPLELYNIWININPPGSYNHLHNHVGAVFSGVYYVSADENQGNIQFERNDGAEYHLPIKMENVTYYNSTRATYKAKTGGMYIFPGWLKHSVQGNHSQKDRISISFNYGEKK